MVQKAKNQKGKKDSKKAKSAKSVKHVATGKAKKASVVTKNVKSMPKLNGSAAKSISSSKGKPAKTQKTAVKAGKPSVHPSNSSKISSNNKKGPALVGKTPAKVAPKGVSRTVVAVETIAKAPVVAVKIPAGKPALAKKAPKPPKPKKIFRSEMIFPNQLKETPLVKVKNKPEPKGKFVLEFAVKSSPALLFDFLSTPSGLSEWFADDVDIRNQEFTFHWDGQIQRAKLLAFKQDQLMRMRWFDKNEDFYFEFRIDHDELTGDVTLIVTDFGESDDDIRTSRLLWESQVNKLLKVLGGY